MGSEFTGKCFFDFASLPFSGAFERFNGAGVIVMQNGVELIGQTRVKIVTDHLCFRPVTPIARSSRSFRRCDATSTSSRRFKKKFGTSTRLRSPRRPPARPES